MVKIGISKLTVLMIAMFTFYTFPQATAVMNEIFPRGTNTDPDWIEIFNATDSVLDISNFKIYDSGAQSGSKPKKLFPNGSVLPAHGYLVIVTDDTSESAFGLSNSGEWVWLEDTLGVVIDSVLYSATATVNESYGRLPDGGDWQLLGYVTRGFSNVIAEENFIYINELFSRGTDTEPDWIEIYNTSSSEIDISGYKIYDSGGQSGSKPKKEFPNGSIIPANGFLAITVDDTSTSGFGLSSNGEWVWLENTSGVVIDSIDLVAISDTAASYGRLPNGADNWQILVPRTKGYSNIVVVPSVVINELFSRGTDTEPDWIEIYNPTSVEIDISNFKIYDSGGKSGSKPKKSFPVGSVISAQGFLVVVTDNTGDASDFGLSSSGEWVWLEDSSGIVIDSVNLVAIADTAASYGRLPDGDETWKILLPRTKGYSNVVVTPTVVINELFSRGTDTEPDWVEIYNPTLTAIDISGYKIYDNGGESGSKPKKEFPSGSLIEANGFLVITVDDTSESGFGLSSSGEKVWLENSTGIVIDSVNLAAISDTAASYGRLPDGSENWQILIPRTKGASNLITDVDKTLSIVSEYQLLQNYPNPFNPSTNISYVLPVESNVKIIVYNLIGQRVMELVNSTVQSGYHSLTFDAERLSSGVYFYSITASSLDGKQSFQSIRKMTLLK